MSKLNIARDFSKFPAGRYTTDGPFPGETFRLLLVDALGRGPVTVVFDDTFGYGSSFLEEAFGGLVRLCGFSASDLHSRMTIETGDPSLSEEVWSYIDSASPEADGA
jgi:STAS-like domain of unknown function (DUF4325)